jgi:hypothetical protein
MIVAAREHRQTVDVDSSPSCFQGVRGYCLSQPSPDADDGSHRSATRDVKLDRPNFVAPHLDQELGASGGS